MKKLQYNTECNAQIENDGDEVSEPKRSVFPDVSEHDRAQDRRVQLEAHVQERVLQSLRLQDPALLLRVVLEHRVPSF